MIDFPASPVDGQIFSSTNGVVYKWSATYSSWLAQTPPPVLGGTGDFCASAPSASIGLSAATVLFGTIVSGNSGSWYNPANGRWTPPAGRYNVYGYFSMTAAGGSTLLGLTLRKNGVAVVPSSQATTPAANVYAETSFMLTVDANGADYFDVQCQSFNFASSAAWVVFGASPLTGMQGPTGGPPGAVVGDFYAQVTAANFPIPTGAATTVLYDKIITGNSGAYYNPANGRYTPPAGRYYMRGVVLANAPAAVQLFTYLRKNGVVLTQSSQVPAGASWSGDPTVAGIFDANGTDWFDVQVSANTASTIGSNNGSSFLAFPTQGMVGPQGPPGFTANSLYLHSEQVLVATTAAFQINFPAAAKLVEIWFDLPTTTPGANNAISMRAVQSGTPNAGANYSYAYGIQYSSNQVAAAQASGQTQVPLINSGISAWGVMRLTKPANFKGVGDWMSMDATSNIYENKTGVFTPGPLTGVDGVQFTTAGLFAIGSYARAMVLV